jgi:DNA-binding NtrC family response regulator
MRGKALKVLLVEDNAGDARLLREMFTTERAGSIEFKAVPAQAMIPIIVVSGRSGAANRERALKAGAKAFLEKPVDNAELLAVIRQALGETVKRERPLVHELGSL